MNIGSSERFLTRGGIAEHPFLFEALDVALREQDVVGQSLSFWALHLGGKHQERTENGQLKKGYKAAACNLKDNKLSPR
jgi:hypothetical protein